MIADNITTCERGLLPLLCVASISSEEVAEALGMSLEEQQQITDPTLKSPMLITEGNDEKRNSYLLTDVGLERLQRSLTVRTASLSPDSELESPLPPQRSISMRNPQMIKRLSQIPLPYSSDLSPASAYASDDSTQALRPSPQGPRTRYSQGYDIPKSTLLRKSSA